MRGGHWLMVAAVVLVLATVAAAVAVMDPPSRERAERLDRKRVQDLQSLAQRIDAHFDVHDRLPAQLGVVDGAPGRAIVDPATGRRYEYEALGDRRYRLCATFETEGGEPAFPIPHMDDWRHAAGRQCFEREVSEVAHTVPVPAAPAPRSREADPAG